MVGKKARAGAIDALRRAVRYDMKGGGEVVADAYHELGLLLMMSKKHEIDVYNEAHLMLQKALKLRPDDEAFQVAEDTCRRFIERETEELREDGAEEAAREARRRAGDRILMPGEEPDVIDDDDDDEY